MRDFLFYGIIMGPVFMDSTEVFTFYVSYLKLTVKIKYLWGIPKSLSTRLQVLSCAALGNINHDSTRVLVSNPFRMI